MWYFHRRCVVFWHLGEIYTQHQKRSRESCAGEISAAPTVCRSGAGSAQCLAQQDTPWPGSISCLAISLHLQRWCRRYLIRGDGVLQGRITSSGGATGVNLSIAIAAYPRFPPAEEPQRSGKNLAQPQRNVKIIAQRGAIFAAPWRFISMTVRRGQKIQPRPRRGSVRKFGV